MNAEEDKATPLWAVVFMGFLAIAGAATEFMTVGMLLTSYEVQSWPTTEGVVLESELIERFEGVLTYEASVRYRFTVEGKQYESASVRSRGTKSQRRFDIQDVVTRYPKGTGVTVYYSATDPASSYLDAGPDWINWLIVVTPLVLALGCGAGFAGSVKERWLDPPQPDRMS